MGINNILSVKKLETKGYEITNGLLLRILPWGLECLLIILSNRPNSMVQGRGKRSTAEGLP